MAQGVLDVFRVHGLTVRYGSAVLALDTVDLRIAPGERLAIIGPSGAGKSTLLRCLNRLVEPSDGQVEFEGREVTHVHGSGLRSLRQHVGMIFQQFNLVARLTVLQNVLVGRLRFRQGALRVWPSLVRWLPRTDHDRALACLAKVGIAELADRRASDLSGGQQQRVAIARVLAQEARVLLADEPIASLDPRSALGVMDLLRRINEESGTPVVVNLHHVDVARRFATRIIGMRQGRIVFMGGPGECTPEVTREIYGAEVEPMLHEPPAIGLPAEATA